MLEPLAKSLNAMAHSIRLLLPDANGTLRMDAVGRLRTLGTTVAVVTAQTGLAAPATDQGNAFQHAVESCSTPAHMQEDVAPALVGWQRVAPDPNLTAEWASATTYAEFSKDDSYLLPDSGFLGLVNRRAREERREWMRSNYQEALDIVAKDIEAGRMAFFTHGTGWRLALHYDKTNNYEGAETHICLVWHPAPEAAVIDTAASGDFGHIPMRSTFGTMLSSSAAYFLDQSMVTHRFNAYFDQKSHVLPSMPFVFSVQTTAKPGTDRPKSAREDLRPTDMLTALDRIVEKCTDPSVMPTDWPTVLAEWQSVSPNEPIVSELVAAKAMMSLADSGWTIDETSRFPQWEMETRLVPEMARRLKYTSNEIAEGDRTFYDHPTGWRLSLEVSTDRDDVAFNTCNLWHMTPDAATRSALSHFASGLVPAPTAGGQYLVLDYKIYDDGEYGDVTYRSLTSSKSQIVPAPPIYLDVFTSSFTREDRLPAEVNQ
ncbi:hypothetical protein [Actibacterium sp. 188UL27-1]|uniref:hypothetical protein n=1 Tax=Actibacterium sp. 188UL27-1 TaxID=2786961 RepID=UPI0019567D81|nr:hypothetical protein [Actibacterium sp. 188UL27-1]MBM7068356.1 hypothetical protein [Actibacterium sp. 188UL27-1]